MALLIDAVPSPVLAGTDSDWEDLSRRVNDWRPTVVVLVARKAPRIRDALGLSLGDGALQLSDLAIPFSQPELHGARVAIVDDVVNVGSTIERAYHRVLGAGASEARVFAIGRCESNPPLRDIAIEYVRPEPLDRDALQELSSRIPHALQTLDKPYDLDFPLLRCRPRLPLSAFDDILAALAEMHGEDRVWDLTTDRGGRHGIRRLAVDLGESAGQYAKARLYADERRRRFSLMPIGITDPLPDGPPPAAPPIVVAVWDSVVARTSNDPDAQARLRLFCDALAMGLRFLADHRHILAPDDEFPFDLADAELVLGPRVRRGAHRVPRPERFTACAIDAPVTASLQTPSPFLAAAIDQGLIAEVIAAAPSSDVISVFQTMFDVLADAVGASDPTRYRWTAPFSRKEVLADPYLRLRIGPTVVDLITLVHQITGRAETELEQTRTDVSHLLDRYIDAGGVVPTTASYSDKIWRIYRKGESHSRLRKAQQIEYALSRLAERPSETRAAKLITTLAYTEPADSLFEVRTRERGNVVCFRENLFDGPVELMPWLASMRRRRDKQQAGD